MMLLFVFQPCSCMVGLGNEYDLTRLNYSMERSVVLLRKTMSHACAPAPLIYFAFEGQEHNCVQHVEKLPSLQSGQLRMTRKGCNSAGQLCWIEVFAQIRILYNRGKYQSVQSSQSKEIIYMCRNMVFSCKLSKTSNDGPVSGNRTKFRPPKHSPASTLRNQCCWTLSDPLRASTAPKELIL